MFDENSIMLIPQCIICPGCNSRYNTFDLLARVMLPESNTKCNHCDFLFTKGFVGKFFGVIKNVGIKDA